MAPAHGAFKAARAARSRGPPAALPQPPPPAGCSSRRRWARCPGAGGTRWAPRCRWCGPGSGLLSSWSRARGSSGTRRPAGGREGTGCSPAGSGSGSAEVAGTAGGCLCARRAGAASPPARPGRSLALLIRGQARSAAPLLPGTFTWLLPSASQPRPLRDNRLFPGFSSRCEL